MDRLDHLISRLYELKGREYIVVSGWSEIDDDTHEIYHAFLDTIDLYIDYCNLSKNIIQASDFNHGLWNEFINFLYYTAQFLRIFSLRFFPSPTSYRLYNYIFIKNLLQTFPEDLGIHQKIKFIITPSDEIALVPISKLLMGNLNVIYESLEQIGSSILQGETISGRMSSSHDTIKNHINKLEAYAFECDPRENLRRKTVLGHEMFHILCRKEPTIINEIGSKLRNGAFDSYIQKIEKIFGRKIDALSHLEEMFCDFGAAWQLGPCYGISSLEELAFCKKEITETHPPRAIRIRIVLEAYKRMEHPYVEKFKRAAKPFEKEITEIKQRDIAPIIRFFKEILKKAGFERYNPSNSENNIKKYIINKIPYIYGQDIRHLFNNIPDGNELPQQDASYLREFLFESVRKNAMWLDFDNVLHEMGFETLKIYLPKELES